MGNKVMIIGSSVCDIVINVDHLPTSQQDVIVTNQTMQLGGCAFNVASVVCNCGLTYDFISPIGIGVYGQFVAEELKKLGITSIVSSDNENGCCYCFVDASGERSFVSYHGVEYSFDPLWLQDFDLTDVAYIYVCGLEVEEKDGQALVDCVCALGRQLIFAPGPRLSFIPEKRIEQLLENGCIVHCNEDEIKQLAQCDDICKSMQTIFDKTHQFVVVTCGDKGCYYFDGTLHFVKAVPTHVVNTVGAGDNHCGAFIAGMALGWSIDKAIAFANTYSACIVANQRSYLLQEMAKKLLDQFK